MTLETRLYSQCAPAIFRVMMAIRFGFYLLTLLVLVLNEGVTGFI